MIGTVSRGIEPVIAAVVLIAVTLVVAVAFIGWFMGLWGTLGATESIKVMPDSFLNSTHLVLHVRNEGSGKAVVYRVDVSGDIAVTVSDIELVGSTVKSGVAGGGIVVHPGADGYVVLSITGSTKPIPGVTYLVTLYTRAGNVVKVAVRSV